MLTLLQNNRENIYTTMVEIQDLCVCDNLSNSCSLALAFLSNSRFHHQQKETWPSPHLLQRHTPLFLMDIHTDTKKMNLQILPLYKNSANISEFCHFALEKGVCVVVPQKNSYFFP